jgi:hypothetical protein
MELKTARLTLLIDPNKKVAFERLCALQDRTASQVVRQLIRDYLVHHGVDYEASGTVQDVTLNPLTAARSPSKDRRQTQGKGQVPARSGAVRPKR